MDPLTMRYFVWLLFIRPTSFSNVLKHKKYRRLGKVIAFFFLSPYFSSFPILFFHFLFFSFFSQIYDSDVKKKSHWAFSFLFYYFIFIFFGNTARSIALPELFPILVWFCCRCHQDFLFRKALSVFLYPPSTPSTLNIISSLIPSSHSRYFSFRVRWTFICFGTKENVHSNCDVWQSRKW